MQVMQPISMTFYIYWSRYEMMYYQEAMGILPEAERASWALAPSFTLGIPGRQDGYLLDHWPISSSMQLPS